MSPNYSKDDRISPWVHITCVNFNKDMYFKIKKVSIKVYPDGATFDSITPSRKTTPESLQNGNLAAISPKK